MTKLYPFPASLALLTTLVVSASWGCQNRSDLASRSSVNHSANQPTESPVAAPVDAKTTPPSASVIPAKPTAPKDDPYRLAVERASSAYTIGKSAQSKDDWRLVAKRWQQAIDLMKTVPVSNPHHAQARQKLTQYQRNLVFAQQQANRSTAAANPDGVVVLPRDLFPPQPAPVAAPPAAPMAAAPKTNSPQPSNGVFHAPIVRREGNTPVIRVMFNNSQAFDMIVDTGASGTLITRQMANKLGVVPVAQTNVDTASQKGVTFPLGYVQSMEVGGAVASQVLVAVAGPELDIGLLGHDFFGDFDVTIRENEVEFRERL
jgi:predicted aspartyl protease